ncbi:DNA (cytosine-5)-methyltransferase 1 [Neorhodopirellula lusitana]|uniref:Cytosine-specific methyltransferase n=1 Tax=Neorhodopirellula lusitana TaxID=445327 RepID=A0ABY1PQC0_9BACT|nr:DNA cytosine methyltransferase [Neorhodopirellula lusitana]SMP42405.1 DNA (cytosine-5)-methyltransferase 1 [Neorhodopirellula lusitana]
MPTTPFKFIDLFSGAGGIAQGFAEAGLKPVLAVEREPDFAATYAENFGKHILTGDIRELISAGALECKADVVAGGPPCQGFSNLTGNKKCDPRRGMWSSFMDVVESSECKVFMLENVPNVLKSAEGEAILSRAEDLGFHVRESASILLASDYGVPQNRRRTIIIGSRLGPVQLPSPHPHKKSVRDAFKGISGKPLHDALPNSPASGSDLHIARNPTDLSKKRYRLIPKGGNRFDLQRKAPHLTPACWIRKTSGGTDLFGRLEWDGPARCTIRTEFYKPEKGRYLHPEEHRPITHWEAARLQTFPDTFRWHGTKIRIAIQIGNAVPPQFAKVLGQTIIGHLSAYRQRPVANPRYTAIQREIMAGLELVAV